MFTLKCMFLHVLAFSVMCVGSQIPTCVCVCVCVCVNMDLGSLSRGRKKETFCAFVHNCRLAGACPSIDLITCGSSAFWLVHNMFYTTSQNRTIVTIHNIYTTVSLTKVNLIYTCYSPSSHVVTPLDYWLLANHKCKKYIETLMATGYWLIVWLLASLFPRPPQT